MCCCSLGAIRMKHGPSLFRHTLCTSFIQHAPPPSLSVPAFIRRQRPPSNMFTFDPHACLTAVSHLFSFPAEVPVSSVLCLSSVRELPVQVRDLYAQGFVLVAVHPFVHPCGPRHAHIQRQLHRAVLVRETLRYGNQTRPRLCGIKSCGFN